MNGFHCNSLYKRTNLFIYIESIYKEQIYYSSGSRNSFGQSSNIMTIAKS